MPKDHQWSTNGSKTPYVDGHTKQMPKDHQWSTNGRKTPYVDGHTKQMPKDHQWSTNGSKTPYVDGHTTQNKCQKTTNDRQMVARRRMSTDTQNKDKW